MIYLIDPITGQKKPPCKTDCSLLGSCAIKPLYGIDI